MLGSLPTVSRTSIQIELSNCHLQAQNEVFDLRVLVSVHSFCTSIQPFVHRLSYSPIELLYNRCIIFRFNDSFLIHLSSERKGDFRVTERTIYIPSPVSFDRFKASPYRPSPSCKYQFHLFSERYKGIVIRTLCRLRRSSQAPHAWMQHRVLRKFLRQDFLSERLKKATRQS